MHNEKVFLYYLLEAWESLACKVMLWSISEHLIWVRN